VYTEFTLLKQLYSRSFVYFLNTTFTSSYRWTGPVKSLPVSVLWLHTAIARL